MSKNLLKLVVIVGMAVNSCMGMDNKLTTQSVPSGPQLLALVAATVGTMTNTTEPVNRKLTTQSAPPATKVNQTIARVYAMHAKLPENVYPGALEALPTEEKTRKATNLPQIAKKKPISTKKKH
jgi:hypothetical protein